MQKQRVRQTLKIFTGNAHPALAQEICAELGVPLGKAHVGRFPDGEVRLQVLENVRGADVFVIQPTCRPVNDNLVELLVMLDALSRASAARITAVMPYFAYARQDRKDRPRVPISSKLVADLLTSAGADRVLALELHAGQIQGFFDIPVDHLYATPVTVAYFRRLRLKNLVVVSPDTGGALRARRLGRLLDAPIAIIDKRRPRDDAVEVVHVVGDVAGMHAVIVDDLISTGGTLISASEALKGKGATGVDVVATHGLLTEGALERLREAPIDEICVTDTIPVSDPARVLDNHPRLRVLSVAPLIAEAIVRVHEGRSVSELFR